MRRYNPYKRPKANEWLRVSEARRVELVEKAHVAEGIELEAPDVHASLHVVVENQLAKKIPDVIAAHDRLRKEGLDRHECIHAIGSVLVDHIFIDGVRSDIGYFERLQGVTAADWLAKYDAT